MDMIDLNVGSHFDGRNYEIEKEDISTSFDGREVRRESEARGEIHEHFNKAAKILAFLNNRITYNAVTMNKCTRYVEEGSVSLSSNPNGEKKVEITWTFRDPDRNANAPKSEQPNKKDDKKNDPKLIRV